LSRLEGIIPALETAHAVSWIASQKGRWTKDDAVLLCVSGRGDKDVAQVSEMNILGT
jgi:tryptophan synthase beta chain